MHAVYLGVSPIVHIDDDQWSREIQIVFKEAFIGIRYRFFFPFEDKRAKPFRT